MKSSPKLDDQTRLSRFMTGLEGSAKDASPSVDSAKLSIDELTRELETHGLQAKQIYSGVAAIFEKAGIPTPSGLSTEPAWLSRAREKKRWFQDKLKQVKEAAQDSLNIGAEPVPVFFRNQNTVDAPAADQESLKQDQRLLDLIEIESSTKSPEVKKKK